MYPKATLVAFLVALTTVSSVRAQCLTQNDDLSAAESVDLSVITDFGLDLFKTIFPYNTTQRNFFFSPYSIWNALTLAYFGSEGNTSRELQKVLKVSDKLSTYKNWRALEYMYRVRQMEKSEYTFRLANRAYFDKTVNLRKCMTEILHSEIETVDFSKTLEAAKNINDFVANVTKGRITELVGADDLQNANMVLANAAFFKGTWLYQFKPSNTKKQVFYTSPEEYTFVDMMVQKGNFRSGPAEVLGAHVLELPYTGETISMFIVLPPFIAGEEGFTNMVSKLNASTLQDAIDHMWRGEVEVSLPKFKLEETVGNELIESLHAMGIRDLFDPAKANLTAFSSSGRLSVGKSIHKAFVEVSEEGTEAAAATALISFRVARPLGPQKFLCNHPFLFIIYDNETKNILFMGAYKNPKA